MQLLINHINDVLPAVEGREEFKVNYREDYTVIDYVFLLPDSFDDPRRLECRGIKFYPDGRIMARPFHKFFNVGEKEQPRDIDWTREHIIMHKLDGSMVHSAMLDGHRPVLMTRMGHTDVAKQAEKHMSIGVESLISLTNLWGITVIFEFTSPDNRIVIKYDRPELSLLAVRDNETGRYWSYDKLESLAAHFKIPLVPKLADERVTDPVEFLAGVRALEDLEGYVIAFDDGHMLKAKAEDYLLQHRTKSYFEQEKDVLRIVLEGKVDDLIPLLDEEGQERIKNYAAEVNDRIGLYSRMIYNHVTLCADLPQKEFALATQRVLDKRLCGAAFKARKYGEEVAYKYSALEARATIVEMLLKYTSSGTKVEQIRDLLNVQWEK